MVRELPNAQTLALRTRKTWAGGQREYATSSRKSCPTMRQFEAADRWHGAGESAFIHDRTARFPTNRWESARN